jgi:hypothetical protein
MGDNGLGCTFKPFGDPMKNLEIWRTIGILAMFIGGFLANGGHGLAWFLVIAGVALTVWTTFKWWKQL